MRARSSSTEDQREAAVALFEDGRGSVWVAGNSSGEKDAVTQLHKRWRVRGRTVLKTGPIEVLGPALPPEFIVCATVMGSRGLVAERASQEPTKIVSVSGTGGTHQ
ncbi:hypothetical protein [Rhodococcus sp. 1168]|uniref:hypothetical protein n=1 Tax=Rhodococcus sp. 1168 TaxID=2018041 RepID=UPI000A0ECBAA|nr:hypothetical protein [Rhodococcus sp. 1168]ORI15450.1 hypothetical protein BJI47_14330 [Rhodococcus sp. 1168]